jgi:hypothetical protein
MQLGTGMVGEVAVLAAEVLANTPPLMAAAQRLLRAIATRHHVFHRTVPVTEPRGSWQSARCRARRLMATTPRDQIALTQRRACTQDRYGVKAPLEDGAF